jgi:hypothetical protein
VSQLIPKPVRTDARCTSMLASSSHMEGAGELGCDLQDLGQSLGRKGGIERVIDLFEGHTAGQAFED